MANRVDATAPAFEGTFSKQQRCAFSKVCDILQPLSPQLCFLGRSRGVVLASVMLISFAKKPSTNLVGKAVHPFDPGHQHVSIKPSQGHSHALFRVQD